jgi:hypothetical protein
MIMHPLLDFADGEGARAFSVALKPKISPTASPALAVHNSPFRPKRLRKHCGGFCGDLRLISISPGSESRIAEGPNSPVFSATK